MRLDRLGLVLLLACAPEAEAPAEDPICPNVCFGSLEVRFSNNLALDLFFIEGLADGEPFAFDCHYGEYVNREGFLEMTCSPYGFQFLRDAPAELELVMNEGTYVGTVRPKYGSAHPYPECDHLCLEGVATFDLGY